MDKQKSYYAIIPANVRYDKNLNPNSKLLYGEITALCNEKGYCWASNKYFAELYEVSETSISLWIKKLVDNGYIDSKIEDNFDRKLYIASQKNLKGVLRKVKGGIKKTERGVLRKVKDNNTYNIKNNNTYNITSSNEEEKDNNFNSFWKEYPKRRVDKPKCKDKFLKLDIETQKKIIQDIKDRKVKDYKWIKNQGQFIPMTSTYLNNKKWEDDYEENCIENNDEFKEIISIFEKHNIFIPKNILESENERKSAIELFKLKGVEKVSNMLDYCLELVEESSLEDKKFISRFDTPYYLLKNYEIIKMKMK